MIQSGTNITTALWRLRGRQDLRKLSSESLSQSGSSLNLSYLLLFCSSTLDPYLTRTVIIIMNSICQSLSSTTHKIYGKCTAAILVYLKLPAELSINSYWLLKFVLLSVINFIGWRVYSCLVKFFGCIFFKQLIYHLPTTREINAFDVYYTWEGLDIPMLVLQDTNWNLS